MPRRKAKSPKKRQAATRSRAIQVKGDMLRNPSLTLRQAARNRDIDARTVRAHIESALFKDSSGRIKARPSDRFRETLHIPSTQPGIAIPVPTKNRRERQLVGQWMTALNASGRGDFSKIREFPKGQYVGGVHLPTDTHEVQRILNALAEEESPYEGLYRTLARPS